MPHQLQLLPLPQVGAGADAQGVHLFGRDLPDAEETLDGKLRDKGVDLAGRDDEQPVGLPVVRGDLRQHFVHRNARRGRESGLRADAGFDLPGHERRRADVRNVEERLVQRERFDEFGIVVENIAYLLRNGFIDIEACRHENQRRQSRLASAEEIAEWTPNGRAS